MKSKIQFAACFILLHSTFVLSAHAQGTTFTYQGRVTASGEGFTGAGQFKFALVTSTNASHIAAATANAPSGGYITGYTVTVGGSGYLTAPAVTVSGGGGSGAAAHANISGGAVSSLTVDNTGDGGYTSAPTVLIAPPPANASYMTYWSNDGTSINGSEPTAAVNVAVNNGLFTVILGDATQPNMTVISAALFNRPNLQLRIWFNDGAHGWAALDPAQSLTPTPYAVFANMASNLVNGLTVQQNTNGAPNVIGGASANYVSDGVVGATIAGGGAANYHGISYSNKVTGSFGTISGGYGNTASEIGTTVSGGYNNTANHDYATVGGGVNNTASGYFATVGGGQGNTASGSEATVGGGYNNTASQDLATVGGGIGNTASGYYSFAAGYSAQALHTGSFVWADDGSGTPFASTANNQFSVRASGGIRLAGDVQLSGGNTYHNLSLSGGNAIGYLYGSYPAFGDGIHLGYNYYADTGGSGHVYAAGGGTSRVTTGYGFVGIYVGGANIAPNTQRLYADNSGITLNSLANPGTTDIYGPTTVHGSFSYTSDRNAKQDFAPVSAAQILERVLRLPVSEWSYKDEPTTRHIGPMAQDFQAVFQIGTDEKHIAPVDEGGLAFAAIQGLNEKVEAKSQKAEDRIQQLEAQNAELRGELNELKSLLKSMNEKQNGGAK